MSLLKDFAEAVDQRESKPDLAILHRIEKEHPDAVRLLHGLIGISTESGEILDQYKRHIFYGTDLDTGNIKEELGDLLWYVTLICNVLGCTLEDIMQLNMDKLKLRYPNGFSQEAATNRDIDTEQKVFNEPTL